MISRKEALEQASALQSDKLQVRSGRINPSTVQQGLRRHILTSICYRFSKISTVPKRKKDTFAELQSKSIPLSMDCGFPTMFPLPSSNKDVFL